MKARWLLVLPFLAHSLAAVAAPVSAAGDLPPRLVRYFYTDKAQLKPLIAAHADFAAEFSNLGKGWVDVLMPASSRMGEQRFSGLASAVRGLRSKVVMEDAEAQMRKLASEPNLGVYHTLAEVKSEIDAAAAAHPDIARVMSIGKSGEGRDIWAIRISGSQADGVKPAFLFTGAHHAREWISIEVPMGIIKHLLDGYATDAAVKKLVDEREIWIVPVVNPDGVNYSQTQYKMWRKNRRPNGDGTFGVDVNRNYGYKWGGDGASPDPGDDTYRGPAAFSEPETQAIRDLARAKKFVAAISFHSYSELVLWAWGYTNEPSKDAATFEKFGQAMAQFNGYTPEQSIDLYVTTGDFDDWMYGEMGCLSYTIELGTQFVPDESEVPGIVAKNLQAAMYLLENASEPFPPLIHDALPTTTDLAGPYAVQAKLRDPAAPVASFDLVYRRAGAAAEQRVPMKAGQGGAYSGAIPGGAQGEVSYHFELKLASGRSSRLPAQGENSFKVVDSLVLLVAGDAGSGYSRYYKAALDGMGKAYSLWDTKTKGSPTQAEMRGASAVIWFTGDKSSNTLTAADQTSLAEYLAAGGRLLLFGQDIGYDIKDSAFYKDTLKAKFVADSSGDNNVSGSTGSFAAGIAFTLGAGDAVAQRYPDEFDPLPGASALMAYGNQKIGALTAPAGNGRLAYFGFGLEGIGSADSRSALLSKALAWAAAAPSSDAARMRELEKAAKAGDRGAAAVLAAARDDARKALEAARARGDTATVRGYALTGATKAGPMKPVAREAVRFLKFDALENR